MSLSVVIPNYNGSRTVCDTLDSVYEQIPAGTHVLIVDDHSSDNSIDLIEANFPLAEIYRGPINLGAAASRNRGISLTHADWLIFVDADVCLGPRCFTALLSAADQADIIFPTIRYPNGEIMYPVGKSQELYLLISPIFLIRRDALLRLDQPCFDETYRVYCEDTDFFLRAYLAGLKSLYVPEAEAIHNVNLQAGNREDRYFLEVRNSLYGAVKFAGAPSIDCLDHAFKLTTILRVLACGLFNFNLFDMQARGFRKHGGFSYNLRLLLRAPVRITQRNRVFLVFLSLKAFAWNLRHLSQAIRSRRKMLESLTMHGPAV